MESSFAATLPETGFSFDIIKHVRRLYLATTSYPIFINKKTPAWLNLQMTPDQSILANWQGYSTQLVDFRDLDHLPQIAAFVTFPHIKHIVIDGLQNYPSRARYNL
ncbi:hypothetical protein HDU80_005940 [Chytriomyces hyalinus]|nr:hypothetical protein HDU80_005940 [Chytriomyces hyalinus]